MVVLAGGRSSRMGSDKCDLKIEKSTFLEWQIEKGRALGITDIQVSGYHGAACSVPVTPDRFPGKGPLGGLESCFRRAREEQVLVLGVDIPLVPAEELERLVIQSREKQKKAVILRHRGKEEPLQASTTGIWQMKCWRDPGAAGLGFRVPEPDRLRYL